MFSIAVAQVLWLPWQVKVSIDLKWEKRKLAFIEKYDVSLRKLLQQGRCFEKRFTEMVVEWSSTKLVILVQTTQFDW